MKETLSRYVHKKLKLAATVTLSVKEVSNVEGTCYRKLRFAIAGGAQGGELELYLSPDRRFLMRELADLRLDPDEEETRKAEQLRVGLTEGKFASYGSPDAPVTIVVFSDFQCPFCKDAAGLLDRIAESEGNRVRIVFRHLPLTAIHPWARPAAEAAACAQLQSDRAFQQLHDLIFENQSSFTSMNARLKLIGLARSVPTLDQAKFGHCIEEGTTSEQVSRDVRFAETHGIEGTPTIFVNGRRLQGVRSEEHLRAVVREAADRAAQTKSAAR